MRLPGKNISHEQASLHTKKDKSVLEIYFHGPSLLCLSSLLFLFIYDITVKHYEEP